MKKENLVLYVSVFGLLMALSLLMMAVGALGYGLGLLAGGMVLFVLMLWLPLAWFVAGIAKRLDVLAETGNDWTPFKENGQTVEKEKTADR